MKMGTDKKVGTEMKMGTEMEMEIGRGSGCKDMEGR